MSRPSLIALLLLAPFAAFAGDELNDCDRYAGHPSDPDKRGPGVGSADVMFQKAIPACRAAVEAEPDNARYRYQLGRVIVYWATTNGADPSEGAALVRQAADAGHTQAEFVAGLLKRGQPEAICDVEALNRKAADKGLKAARIAYAVDYTGGLYDGCDDRAKRGAVRDYVKAAGDQIDGYYENLLLGMLKRELEAD